MARAVAGRGLVGLLTGRRAPPMPVLLTRVDRASEAFAANRAAMLARLAEIEALLARARAGGGQMQAARHRARGGLLARERIELLLDRDAPFLELSPLAAWGTESAVGGGSVTGIGAVSGVECAILANDPTVRGGEAGPLGLAKVLRIMDIARRNRLPIVTLADSGGDDPPQAAELFIPGGAVFKNYSQLSAAGIPSVAVVLGASSAAAALVPAMCDYTVMVRGGARVFLAGPPQVKRATGEDADEEELGGAEMHSRVSGLSDYLAADEPEALRLGRQIVAHLRWRKLGRGPTDNGDPPVHDPEDLLGIASIDLRVPFEAREVVARIVDGSRFDEFKPLYGTTLVAGWGSIHGFGIGILANNGVLFSEEAEKAAQFVQLTNRLDLPLVFVQNTTGYMVGKAHEQGGIIRDGARMLNAVANSGVPHVTLMAGGSHGVGNYGMCGRAFEPRFVFTWPNHRTSATGVQRLAETAPGPGRDPEVAGAPGLRGTVGEQAEGDLAALSSTGHVWDDGIIDPRDTRTVLGIVLSAAHSAEVRGASVYGAFR